MATRTAETSLLFYARVAGATFLFYIVAGITSLALADQKHMTEVLSIFTSLSALVLGVMLYAITYRQEPALAILALTCRVLETASVHGAIFFAVGSTLFCWLLLRGRLIPLALAWLGILASAMLVIILLLQLAELFGSTMAWSASITWLVWLPMFMFEVTLAFWFLIKGVALPTANLSPAAAKGV